MQFKSYIKFSILIIGLPLVSGCVSNKVWVRDNTSGSVAQQDFANCKYDAEKNGFVPMGLGTSAISAGVQQGFQTAELMNQCMNAKGYYLKDKKKIAQTNTQFLYLNSLMKNKRFEQALTEVNRMITANTELSVSYGYRGHLNFILEDYHAAISDFNKSASLGSKDIQLVTFKSIAFVRLGEPDIAIEVVNQSLKEKSDAHLFNARAYALNAKNEFDSAINDINKAIAMDSSLSGPYKNKGVSYLGKGLYDEALKEFNKALALSPNYGWAYAGRSDVYSKLNDVEATQADRKKACDLGIKSYCY